MKTIYFSGRGRGWFLVAAAFSSALVLPVGRAQDPEKTTLNKPTKIIGDWQSVGRGDTVTVSLTEKGEFEFGGIENGKKVVETKGTYTVEAASSPLKLTFVSGGRKSYGAIAVLSNDRILLEKLGSLEETPAWGDGALTLTRQHEASANSETNAANDPDKLIGKWKSIGDPAALEGASMTMSFSEKGGFEMTVAEKGEEEQTFKGSYTVDASNSPLRVAVVSGDKKGYYAMAILPKGELKAEELKSPDQVARLTEEAITLVRESK